MFSSWVVRDLHGYRAFPTNLHPPQERTLAASETVPLNIICVINTFQYDATNRYRCKE
jgi:hypothetical protein